MRFVKIATDFSMQNFLSDITQSSGGTLFTFGSDSTGSFICQKIYAELTGIMHRAYSLKQGWATILAPWATLETS